ncbi:MAG: phosphate ABC transporter substrate-binding protein PstS [Rhodopila sp.]|jgi:phosphate transport system substrate-binding protein
MRYILFAMALVWVITTSAAAQEILGSGSTFCYPVMMKWVDAYEKVSGAHIVYQPIGSAGGITEIRHEIVDFAVSEAPLDDAQLLRDGLAQFPLVIGAIVPVVNVDGVAAGQLRVTGQLLADIYLGKITKWNDPAIAAMNPGLKLPGLAISVVHRSDGSGTTFVWADYLSKVSNDWMAKVGENTTVAWPTGFGGKGNGGVAEKVARVPGSIGYIDYAYAARGKLAYVLVQNRAGNFVTPATASFEAATADVDWMKERDFNILLTDAPATNAYPIMATSFALIRKYPKDPGHARDMLGFLRWVLESGRDMASAQAYLPLPSPLVQQIEGYWETEKR